MLRMFSAAQLILDFIGSMDTDAQLVIEIDDQLLNGSATVIVRSLGPVHVAREHIARRAQKATCKTAP
jgi:hypothetical protein